MPPDLLREIVVSAVLVAQRHALHFSEDRAETLPLVRTIQRRVADIVGSSSPAKADGRPLSPAVATTI